MEAQTSQAPPAPPSAPPSAAAAIGPTNGLIDYTHWIYALQALTVIAGLLTMPLIALRFMFGLPSIAAVVMAYLRRSEAHGTWLESHFRWQIRTFWFSWLWMVVTSIVAVPLLIIGIGFLIGLAGLALVGVWVIYRVIRGWITLRDARPVP
jgi:uncharacterized membrane protein